VIVNQVLPTHSSIVAELSERVGDAANLACIALFALIGGTEAVTSRR